MPASVIACGVILALADNILSFAYHGYQPELFPTRLRARRWVSSISSCSQLSTMSNALMIAAILRGVTPPPRSFNAGCMAVLAVVIGIFGASTKSLPLEKIPL